MIEQDHSDLSRNARLKAVADLVRGRNVTVTGAAGSVGKGVVARLLELEPTLVRLVDNNETELFFLEKQFGDVPVVATLGDVRDRDTLTRAFKGADMVFHLAALKHVPLCERTPLEAVQTNIIGVQNAISAAIEAGVPRLVCTSSDKAVNPTSVMGASKLMGERLVNAANTAADSAQTFHSTRFGNVLGSRGSVVPIFVDQIRKGGPVTLTDSGMTRFIMTLRGSVDLILESAALARGGEVFITKMRAVRIEDLAQAMIAELAPEFGHDPADVKIEITGQRPGEKIFEELMTTEEVRHSIEFDRHFAVLPPLTPVDQASLEKHYPEATSGLVTKPYISETETAMTVGEIRTYLRSNGVLETAGALR